MAKNYILLWLCELTSTFAQLQTFVPPGQSQVSYSVNIPQHTADSNTGPIYFQLKSTQNVEWLAWGQGTRMLGANIFVVYASRDGNNITVSPRLGLDHVEPTYNSETKLSVLEGSGIKDGVITANIRCDTCINWEGGHEDPNSSSSSWIWAVKYGSPLKSNSLSALITEHDSSGIATLNLQQASGGASSNPFLDSSNITTTTMGQATTEANSVQKLRIAHAVIMSLVFIILLPSFALILRVFPSSMIVNIHAASQIVTLALAVAGLGIGIAMARTLHLVQSYHPIIGIFTVSSLCLFQPAMGFLQHRYFRKTGGKGSFAYLHRWTGRCLIVLGIINGGLGFRLAGVGSSAAPKGAIVAYSVVAGVAGLGYLLGTICSCGWKSRHISP